MVARVVAMHAGVLEVAVVRGDGAEITAQLAVTRFLIDDDSFIGLRIRDMSRDQALEDEVTLTRETAMQRMERLTITVDPEFVAAGHRAVAAGQADSISGWVSAALAEQIERARRLSAMATAVQAFEQEFGAITDAEIEAQRLADEDNAMAGRR